MQSNFKFVYSQLIQHIIKTECIFRRTHRRTAAYGRIKTGFQNLWEAKNKKQFSTWLQSKISLMLKSLKQPAVSQQLKDIKDTL